ncbi:hypothetical protein Ssi03_37750 [Sphaerisporangium siamense]|uniref:Uncharacterized protein n=1 Tax=Sphaerisporangium siamense TaxID=795645 RepID=A0A7W7D691_9ACTN|nr:hypothetical protein [Sphaerisporangium siamense]MBB4701069.1 hypothetical protein [Sphaerisporangium siamense]GII85785.1 hypothetical protein Ssi03_37750 [Sphaerisporangium siamense]
MEEALRCYHAGALRAAIGQTWIAVVADLTEKIVRLADEGDGDANDFHTQLESAQAAGLATDGVTNMQAIERSILDIAAKMELIDTIAARELERLRQDRHLCVHPSLRRLGEAYQPLPESARAHMATAQDSLLIHPPTQGRKVIDDFMAHVTEPQFSTSPAYLLGAFFARVRPTARRKIVDLAAKHALAKLPGPPEISPILLADRTAECLHAFTTGDSAIVAASLKKSLDRLSKVDGQQQLRAAARLAELDAFWDLLDAPLTARLDELIAGLAPSSPWELLTPDNAEALSVVRVTQARAVLPRLEITFGALSAVNRAQVMARHVAPYFVSYVPELLAQAPGWRGAEEITRTAVVPYGPLMTVEDLQAALTAWSADVDCRTAGGMRNLAVKLYRVTAHLRSVDQEVWEAFLTDVRALEPEQSMYRYTELEAAMSP